jgi:hypothetical protein
MNKMPLPTRAPSRRSAPLIVDNERLLIDDFAFVVLFLHRDD